MNWAILAIFFLWAIAISLTLYSTYLTLSHFRDQSVTPDPIPNSQMFPISILKPLKGVDQGIEENLKSFFGLNYPHYELIFSVATSNDPVCEVVMKLMNKYPHIPSRLLIGRIDIGLNPKVNNLVLSYQQAKFDWVLISDSNVRVQPDYLTKMRSHVRPNVGLVTSVVSGQEPRGIGGLLEAVFLNTFYARGMILAGSCGHPCVVGKSMFFQRSEADRFGGIRILAQYLAEDYMAGEAMKHLGRNVITSTEPIIQYIGEYSFIDFWSRHLRWGRIRKVHAPLLFYFEPLWGSIVSGLMASCGFSFYFGVSPALFLSLHLTLCFLCDLSVLTKLGMKLNLFIPMVWLLRELLAFPLWLFILAGNTVQWRGQKLELQPGGTLRSSVLQ